MCVLLYCYALDVINSFLTKKIDEIAEVTEEEMLVAVRPSLPLVSKPAGRGSELPVQWE